jgi:UDP-N-acetylmuramoylalanine-D-glutamate ligase
LQEAVVTAFDIAKQQSFSTILYSPGAASFDMFKNVYERVEQFETIVQKL